MGFTKLDYCQYLLSSQVNYTLTNLAEHLEQTSHDPINRYLRSEKITPNLLWDNVKHLNVAKVAFREITLAVPCLSGSGLKI
jgi:hypothetical protein